MQRLTDQELLDVLNDTESDRAKRKETFKGADVLNTFGFIQAFGRGIAVSRRAMESIGNPAPEFQTSQSAVVCILREKS